MAIVICPDCGKEQDNLNKFCRNCGGDLSKVEVVEVAEEKVEDLFSTADSTLTDEVSSSTVDDAIDENAVVDDPIIATENVKKCSNCGTELTPNVKFCPNCGNSIEEEKPINSMSFCPSCGAELSPNVKFCPNCGLNLNQGISSKPTGNVVSEAKTPIFSVLLSFLFPGLGQFYNGQSTKGLYFIIMAIVSWILMIFVIGIALYFIVWVWSIYDAYKSAEALNRGEVLEDKLFK